jgi:hypothetical protein
MNDDEPFVTDDELALHDEVKLLRQEHSDLDAAIEALGHMPIPDQLRIARLKRKKLLLPFAPLTSPPPKAARAPAS